MKLVDLISKETGVNLNQTMLLRHFNSIERLVELGGTVDEFTSLQPTSSKWDFWADGKPRIEVVVVIVGSRVHSVCRVLGVEVEGTLGSLSSEAHRRFDAELNRGRTDRPARRFRLQKLPLAVVGAEITGWEHKEISPVLRSSSKLFGQIDVELPDVVLLPEEVRVSEKLFEGTVANVMVNSYERNPVARSLCIAHYKAKCVVCGFDFGAVYGPIAEGFVHVHHLKPLSVICKEYAVDPIADLRPVCPNCHAVIHLGGASRSIEEVKLMLQYDAPRSLSGGGRPVP